MAGKTMKTLRLTRLDTSAPLSLTLQNLPIPTPGPGEILIKVNASAIHPSDLLNSRGLFPYTVFPRTPGRDFSGTVVSTSTNPSAPQKWSAGDEVYGTSGNTQAFTKDGAQAEYIVVSENAVAPKPKNLSWNQAACVGVPFTTAWMAVQKAGVKEEETVLVLGANGAVGSAAVQLVRSLGARVLKGLRGGKGEDEIDTSSDPELKKIDELVGGVGVDVVIDTVGVPALTGKAVEKLGRGGRLVFIAAPRSGSTELGIEMTGFYRKERILLGINTLLYDVEEFAGVLEQLGKKFESGELKGALEGEWREVKLADAVEGYEKAGQRGVGKFVITVD